MADLDAAIRLAPESTVALYNRPCDSNSDILWSIKNPAVTSTLSIILGLWSGRLNRAKTAYRELVAVLRYLEVWGVSAGLYRDGRISSFQKGHLGKQFEYQHSDAYGIIKTEVELGGPNRLL